MDDEQYEYIKEVLERLLRPYVIAAREWWQGKRHSPGYGNKKWNGAPIDLPLGFMLHTAKSMKHSSIKGLQIFPYVEAGYAFRDVKKIGLRTPGGLISFSRSYFKDGVDYEIDGTTIVVVAKENVNTIGGGRLLLALLNKDEWEQSIELENRQRCFLLHESDVRLLKKLLDGVATTQAAKLRKIFREYLATIPKQPTADKEQGELFPELESQENNIYCP